MVVVRAMRMPCVFTCRGRSLHALRISFSKSSQYHLSQSPPKWIQHRPVPRIKKANTDAMILPTAVSHILIHTFQFGIFILNSNVSMSMSYNAIHAHRYTHTVVAHPTAGYRERGERYGRRCWIHWSNDWRIRCEFLPHSNSAKWNRANWIVWNTHQQQRAASQCIGIASFLCETKRRTQEKKRELTNEEEAAKKVVCFIHTSVSASPLPSHYEYELMRGG